jgi:hypothetical protein
MPWDGSERVAMSWPDDEFDDDDSSVWVVDLEVLERFFGHIQTSVSRDNSRQEIRPANQNSTPFDIMGGPPSSRSHEENENSPELQDEESDAFNVLYGAGVIVWCWHRPASASRAIRMDVTDAECGLIGRSCYLEKLAISAHEGRVDVVEASTPG